MAGNHDCHPIALDKHVSISHCIQEFQEVSNRQEVSLMALAQKFNENVNVHGQDTSMFI